MPQIDIDFTSIFARLGAFLQLAALIFGVVFAAFWIAMIVWTFRDIRARSHDIFSLILSVLLVALFPLIGLAIYLLMRPKITLAEAYDRALEEEALMQTIEERPICNRCGRRVEKDFLLCPHCYNPLKKPCQECARLISLDWAVCPYCGHAAEPAAPEAVPVEPTLPPQPVTPVSAPGD